METIVVMAHAMGRTLVLPPSQGVYLLRKDRDKQRVHFSFEDFYHMEQIGYEHDGLNIISMQEFLAREAMTGNLKNKTSGIAQFPPENRTDWDGMDPKTLKEYLRDVTLTPLDWKPEACLAAFPSDEGPEHFNELNGMMDQIKKDGFPKWQNFKDKPVDVDASSLERMREAVSRNIRDLCIYDENMQKAPVVHFMCYHKMRVRMLTHFYAFLYFEVRFYFCDCENIHFTSGERYWCASKPCCIWHLMTVHRTGGKTCGANGSSVITFGTRTKSSVPPLGS